MEQRLFDGCSVLVNDPGRAQRFAHDLLPRVLFCSCRSTRCCSAVLCSPRKKFFFVDHLILLAHHPHLRLRPADAGGGAAQILRADVAWGLLAIARVYGLTATRNFYRQSWF